jgi:NosR/NirI family nitrous oxide reductase transcriptional regulator
LQISLSVWCFAIIPSDPLPVREEPEKSRKRFLLYFVMIPLFSIGGAFLLYSISPSLASVNRTVQLAKEIRLEQKTGVESALKSVIAFKEAGKTEAELFAEEKVVIRQFRKFSPWAGLFLGLSLGIGMISLNIRRTRTEYKPDQGKCYSCGKCFKYCPIKVPVNNES